MAALLLLAALGPARAAEPPPAAIFGPPAPVRVFQGELRCEPLPGLTEGELRAPIRLALAAGEASYGREVRMPTGFSAGRERGAGPLQPDGVLRMEGEGSGRGWSYQVRFAGRLIGREIGLIGQQEWKIGERELRRGCTVSALAR